MGIYTWVSMEPVIIPDEALEVIRAAHSYVDFWKVGKLNHNKEVEQSVDWPKFREDAVSLLESFGSKVLHQGGLAEGRVTVTAKAFSIVRMEKAAGQKTGRKPTGNLVP